MARSAINDALEKFRFGMSWTESGSTDSIFDSSGNLKTSLVRAGFHDIQMPKRATSVITYREGVDADIYSKSPGLSTFEDIVCSRGLLADPASTKEFQAWTRLVHDADVDKASFAFEAGGAASRAASGSMDFRKEALIWMYDREGKVVRAWKIINCWPSNIVTGSDLNSSEDGEKSLEQLTLTFEDMYEVQIDTADTNPPASENIANATA